MYCAAAVGIISAGDQCALYNVISVLIKMPHVALDGSGMLNLRISFSDDIQCRTVLDQKNLTATLIFIQSAIYHKTVHIYGYRFTFFNRKDLVDMPILKHRYRSAVTYGSPGICIIFVFSCANLCNISAFRCR